MLRKFWRRLILKNKELILNEAQHVQGFLQLLFKPRNTDERWNKEEKQLLKKHLKRLSFYVPVLLIFTLSGGVLFLPILAEILDRRKTRRTPSAKEQSQT